MSTLYFKLVTPERVVLETELVSLSCPTTLGQITILPNHAPLIATLAPGAMVAKTKNETFTLAVTGGFVQVDKGSKVQVLADAAEHDFEIDIKRAEEAKQRAQAALKRQSQMSEQEYASVAAALERSLTRLNIARKKAHKKSPISGEGVFHE